MRGANSASSISIGFKSPRPRFSTLKQNAFAGFAVRLSFPDCSCSLAFCALLFLVFLTLELDGNENMPPRTILAPLIALYAMILVFLPLLLLVTRHYVRVRGPRAFFYVAKPLVLRISICTSRAGKGLGMGSEEYVPAACDILLFYTNMSTFQRSRLRCFF